MALAIGKVMLVAEMEGVKQTVKKGWTAMAARGGAAMLVTQIRALANVAARKALENAGKSIEQCFSKTYSSKLARISLKIPQQGYSRIWRRCRRLV